MNESKRERPPTPAGLVDHFFRHEYGRLVSQLAGKVGVRHLELVEDAVQSALSRALVVWVAHEVPRDPAAWLYRVASNYVVTALRAQAGRARILERAASDVAAELERSNEAQLPHFASEVHDDLLRMLFVCCDPDIPRDSRLVLALKTLCGFSTSEIALRLFTTEANVHKRLQRGRARFRQMPEPLTSPSLESVRARLGDVHEILYLLYNEGYLSAHAENAIRRELCDEAIRLATLLAEHAVGAVPETFALLALMHFHTSRLDARVATTGGLLLLEEQDRRRWNPNQIAIGAEWLARSASGDMFSRYHAEAGIAAEHCFAPSFAETRWNEIAALYEMLDRCAPSPLHALNRAVAVAEWKGPAAALAVLEGVVAPEWLGRSYLWDAVLGDLHRRVGNAACFERHRARALASAPSDTVRELLRRRLTVCGEDNPASSARR